MDPILFNICFCQKLVHVFHLDLLKLISRKAWLMMLAVEIKKYTKQRLPALSVPSRSAHLMLTIAKFLLFSYQEKRTEDFFSLISVFLT